MSEKVQATGFSSSKGVEKPIEKMDKRLGFVTWGAKNDYPFYLVDMYNGSAWHQGILKTKTYYIAGGGIEVVSGVMDQFLENQYSDFNIEDVMKRCAFDYEMFDAFAVMGTWNREGSRAVRWEHVDIDSVRTNLDESVYYLSDDWSARKQSLEDTNFREVLPYDKKRTSGKFIIYYKAPKKQAKGEQGIYPKPPYVGGLTAINTDVLISQYHLHEIQNGFKGGTIVNMANGQPETDEEAEAIKDQIKGTSTSIEDTNQLIITFSDGQENAPTVLPLNGNDLADRYNMTEQSVQQNILVAHGATNPLLFGIKTEGQLGGAQELAESFEIFKNVYIQARQESLNWLLNLMAELSGAQGEARLLSAEPVMTEEETVSVANPENVEEVAIEEGDVAGTAMNGAQISSLVGIVEAVGLGTLTPPAAVEVILASFPTIDRDQAEKIVGIRSNSIEEPTFSKHDGQVFRNADKDLKVFLEYGADKSKFKVVKSTSVSNDFGKAEVEQLEFNNYGDFFDRIGQIQFALTDLDKNVLELLRRGEDGASIAKATDSNIMDIAKSIDKLTKLNLLVDGETSTLGENVLQGTDIEVDRYEVRYSYEVKPGLGSEKISTTRPFCETLIDANRMYTRSEINTIGGRIGRDVWRYRGGFYHNPNTGRTTPWCRHEWVQHLVIK